MKTTPRLFIYACLFSLSLSPAFAGDLKGLSDLFKSTFWTDLYEENHCGRNIEKLVEKAMDKNLDLSGAVIAELTDFNGDFGMINALEAREGGSFIIPRRKTPPILSAGRRNWEFHVILIVEGKVLDYDFTNEAKILSVKQYMNEMFIPKERQNDLTWKKKRMDYFELKMFPAEDYILRQRSRLALSPIAKTQKLKVFAPEFFK